MPWCEECAKYWTPNAMNDDGTCPRCGDCVPDQPPTRGVGRRPSTTVDHDHQRGRGDAADDETAPWHFKLLVVATVGYLVWRFVQIFA